jgi:hypothetical protein
MDEDLSGHPASTNAFVSNIDERVRAHSRVSLKQLKMACIISQGIVLALSVNVWARGRQTVTRGPHLHRGFIFSGAPTMYKTFEPIVLIL